MSPIDPKSLEAFAEKAVYVDAPECVKCGYSLEGLPVGARCPECGTPTRRRKSPRRFGDMLTDAPAAYLKMLSTGFAVMAAAGLVCAIFLAMGFAMGPGGLVAAPAGLAWWAAVWVVTGPRQVTGRTEVDPREEHRGLRRINRLTQGAWVGAGLLEASLSMSMGGLGAIGTGPLTGSEAWRLAGMAPCLAVGLVGLGPLSAQLSGLADWANESVVAGRLRAIALGVTVCGGYLVVAVGVVIGTRGIGPLRTLHGALGLLAVFAWPVLIVALTAFLWALFQMSRMSMWALSNAAAARAKDERLRAKFERTQRQAEEERAAGSRVDPPQDPRAV